MILKKLIFFFFLIFNFLTTQSQDFSLHGRTSDIQDGTYLYLRDLVNAKNIDSALVSNNSFLFTTNLPEENMYVMLFKKDRSKFKELWLEEKPMTFNSTKGNFQDAEITGSRNQVLAMEMANQVYVDVQEISDDSLKQREMRFLKKYPNSFVSAYILHGNKRLSQKEIGGFYSELSEVIQTSSLGKKIAQNLEKEIPEVGENYIDFTIPDPSGKKKKISDLRGKLTVLQFWSSTCGFSREMNNTLAEIYSKYKPMGLEVVSISSDGDREKWIRAIEEDELSWHQLSNLQGWKGEAIRGYGIYSTPSNFLIDNEGVIVARNLRGNELENKIKEVLKEKP